MPRRYNNSSWPNLAGANWARRWNRPSCRFFIYRGYRPVRLDVSCQRLTNQFPLRWPSQLRSTTDRHQAASFMICCLNMVDFFYLVFMAIFEYLNIFINLNSELLMCRKIWGNRIIRNRAHKTEFWRIVLNFFNFRSLTNIKDVDHTFFWVIVPFIFDKICCILNLRVFLLQIL